MPRLIAGLAVRIDSGGRSRGDRRLAGHCYIKACNVPADLRPVWWRSSCQRFQAWKASHLSTHSIQVPGGMPSGAGANDQPEAPQSVRSRIQCRPAVGQKESGRGATKSPIHMVYRWTVTGADHQLPDPCAQCHQRAGLTHDKNPEREYRLMLAHASGRAGFTEAVCVADVGSVQDRFERLPSAAGAGAPKAIASSALED